MTAMLCRNCGNPLVDAASGLWCPRCSFESALVLGGSRGGPTAESPADTAIEGYDLLHELGHGSMGVVWLARERALDRLVAVKVIAVGANSALCARLLREGKAAASLRHPHIVAVHALGGTGATAFLAMDFLEGGNLDERLKRGPLPVRDSAEIVVKIAGALAYAHGAGLLHRDLKPSNILMDAQGEPHLADFGLAAPLEGAGDLTLPDQIAGTPAFLAPELLGGAHRAGPASDVYGLGAVLYACLTGRAPFVGESAGAILAQLPEGEPPPPRLLRPGLPRDLETICLKSLEKSPERRYGSAALLQADLQAFLEGKPISARPLGWSGHLVRFCRRRPALALSTAVTTLCLLVLAIGGPLMALRLRQAQAETQERLRDALLARSRATRIAGQIGQRDDALAAAKEAARIRPGLDARDEIIAALARPEIEPLRSWSIKRDHAGLVAFDPDHDRYALEQRPGVLDLRRLSDNGLLIKWRGPAEKLWTFPVFSADGRSVVTRNGRGEVIVWSDARSEPAFILTNRPYVLTGRFGGYGQPDAFSPDGRVLASTLPGTGVSFHSTKDGRELGRIPTDVEATHVAYSADGKLLAVGRGLRSREGRVVAFVRVFDPVTGAEICRPAVDAGFQSLTWAPDRNQLLVTGERLDLYRGSDGKRLSYFSDPLAARGFFGPAGTTLISSTSGGSMTLWDLGTARPLLTGDLGSDPEIAVNQTGDLIAKTRSDDEARLVRLEMSRVVRTWPTGPENERHNVLSAAVSTIDFSLDGRWLATALWGEIQLRDRTGAPVASTQLGTLSNYCSVRFSRDGRSLLAGTAEKGLLRLPIVGPDAARPALGAPETIDPEPGGYITDISGDGTRAVLTSFISGYVKIVRLDGSPGAARWALPGAAGAVFLDHDRKVLANSLDNEGGAKLEVRNAATGERLETLPYAHGAHVQVSADGTQIILGTGANETLLLHTSDWSRGPALPPDVQGRGIQCAFSNDGRMAAFGAGSRVWLVSTADGSVLAHLHGAQGGSYIPGLTFSPDGKTLALWWDTGQLTVWNLERLRRELRSAGLDW